MSCRTWKLGLGFACAFAAIVGSAAGARADEPGSRPAAVPAAPAVSEEQQAEARRQFEAGVALLDDPDGAKYEDAYRAFRKAYELSQSANVLGNVAFCAFHLERDGEAIDAYTTYLREVPHIEDRERTQIQRDVTTLTATVARARITVAQPAPAKSFVLVDKRTQTRGAAVENAYPFTGTEFSVRLRPGRHTLSVKADNVESLPVDVTLEPGSSVTQSLTFPAPSANGERGPGGRRAAPSVVGPALLGAVGLVAIGTGVVTGLVARGKTNDIEKACPNDVCPNAYDLASNRTSAKTFGTIADIGFISGGVLIGGAALWYLLLPRGSSTRGSGPSQMAWVPSAGCAPGRCSFQLERGF